MLAFFQARKYLPYESAVHSLLQCQTYKIISCFKYDKYAVPVYEGKIEQDMMLHKNTELWLYSLIKDGDRLI